MAKFDYTKAAATAERLLEKFGQVGAIPRTTAGTPPNDWTPGAETTVYHAIKCAVLPIDAAQAGQDIDGTLIKSTDVQVLVSVAGLSITPETTDTIIVDGAFNGDVYEGGRGLTILRCNTLQPAGVPVIHDILAAA